MSEAQRDYDHAAALYRRTYDRLYLDSMRAGSKEECDRIDAALRAANARFEEAKEALAKARAS